MAELTQPELANLIGVSRNTVGSWESGKFYPSIDNIYDLCRELYIPLGELFQIQEEPVSHVADMTAKAVNSLPQNLQNMAYNLVNVLVTQNATDHTNELKENYCFKEMYLEGAAAGAGAMFGDQRTPEQVFVRKSPVANQADAIIQVKGHSMEPEYMDGEYVFVRWSEEAREGDDVIALTNNGAVIKRVGNDILYSVNADCPYVHGADDTVKIFGVVIGKVNDGDIPGREVTDELKDVYAVEWQDHLMKYGYMA